MVSLWAIKRAVQAVDKDQPLANVQTLESLLTQSIAPRRFSLLLFGIFAFLALLLGTIGLSGVMSYLVTQRTRELVICLALGAQRGDLLKLIIGQGLRLTLIGMGLGLVGSYAPTRVMTNLLFGVSATDPVTFAGVTLLLTAVTLLACYIPARRVTRVDPVMALRYEWKDEG